MTPETPPTDAASARPGVSRRGLLFGGVAAGGAMALAACGSTKKTDNAKGGAATTATTTGPGASTPTAGPNADAKVAALAASLEVLAVGTYKAALAAATAKKLGEVPPAVAAFATTAMANHQAALEKWNTVLTSAGTQAVTQPPAALKATIDQMFSQVTDSTGLAKLALLLEQTASDTYLSAVSTLGAKDAITLAGQLQVVDQEHASILHYVLGEYPVPDVFQTTAKALASP